MENRFGKKKGMLLIAVVALCVVGTSVAVLANNGTLAAKAPVKSSQATVSTSAKIGDPTQYIGETKVRAILNAKVNGATLTKLYLEMDDGRVEYDGEMYLGKLDYDFTIDAVTGAILEWKAETEDDSHNTAITSKPSEKTTSGTTATYIGEAAARAIALKKVPGATITELYLEHDDGKVEYDGEMILGNIEYEFEFDAVTGIILEWDTNTVEIEDDDSDDSSSDDDEADDDEADDDEADDDEADDED